MVTIVSLFFVFNCGTSLSDEPIAKAVRADKVVKWEKVDQDPKTLEITAGKEPAEISVKQKLSADNDPNGFFQLHSIDASNYSSIKVRNGSIEFKEDKSCEVIGKARFTKNNRGKSELLAGCLVKAGDFFYRHLSTDFLIEARGVETSLFVMEGAVEVSSINPELTQKVVVNAGEWLVTRKGEPIPPAKRYRRTDPVSGNSECIYSWCRLTRGVITEPEGRLGLVPPSPNPPGQR